MKNPILSCTNISFSIEDHEILHDVSFSIFKGEVLALVGLNGVGKSTLLKIIANERFPEINIEYGSIKGKIEMNPKSKIAYFPQEIPSKYNSITVREHISDIRNDILSRLDLNESILDKKIGDLSGGEKSKISLIRMGGTNADLFILDEPTNNLDSNALKYLELLIKNRDRSAFMIISHDRQLLENFADKIMEIDWQTRDSILYPGPFSKYMELRRQRIEKEWQKYNEYLTQKDSLKDALQEKKQWSTEGEKGPKKTDNEKMSAGNKKDWSGKILGKAVKNAQKKIEGLEVVERPREVLTINYPIDIEDRSGDLVLEIKNAKIIRGTKNIGPVDLEVRFGDRLVILGKNGSGKTTIIKAMIGDINPNEGSIRVGSKVKIGYLPQESDLDDDIILNKVKKINKNEETEFRKLLNNFGITKDEMKRGREELSPGERARFVLASIIANKPNCLILDEPTNHLDIFVLDFLEKALKDYKGTVILVTHDRYFLNRIGEYKILDLD